MKYDEIIEINGHKLTAKYIESLSKQERLDLIEPIFQVIRKIGWLYPDDEPKLKKEYQRLVDLQIDITQTELFNNSSLATSICKHFCHSFYLATEIGKPTLIDNFNNDNKLRKMIYNRLGLEWLDPNKHDPEGHNQAFGICLRMLIQAQRSMRYVNATSIFKPDIAKYMTLKYSNPGDIVGDYSCGFGGRLLGVMSTGNRSYIGTDPLTVPELESMAKYFNFSNYKLMQSGSEQYRGEENSVDLYWSSPPYYNQESYGCDKTQAYNNGEEYFYNVYWRKTLENVKYMLKPGKWFGLNITDKYPKMLQMAQEIFGEIKETVQLRTVRSHLTKSTKPVSKMEPIYMLLNSK